MVFRARLEGASGATGSGALAPKAFSGAAGKARIRRVRPVQTGAAGPRWLAATFRVYVGPYGPTRWVGEGPPPGGPCDPVGCGARSGSFRSSVV